MDQAEFDTDMVIVPLSTMKHLLGYHDEASAIEIKVAPGYDIDKTMQSIKDILGNKLSVKDRLHQQEESFRMISVEKWITFFLLAFILVIASFNVISTLSMLVIEKEESIRTLSALGASKHMLSTIFLIEGWLISLIGGILGVAVGVALCFAQQSFGFIKLGGNHDMMTTDIYPVKVEFPDILAVLLLVAVLGGLTSTVTSIFTRQRLREKA